MKKIFSFLLMLGILFGLSSCLYIGLLPKEVKKHTEKIVEQLKTFSLDPYCGAYYSVDGKTTIHFYSKNDSLELFIITEKEIYYTDNKSTWMYEIQTKEETIQDGTGPFYEEACDNIQYILDLVGAYDGNPDKQTGTRGAALVGDEILDRVTHYCYNMDWNYSDIAMFDFYVSADTSNLYYFTLRDISNTGGFGKSHFEIEFNPSIEINLKEEYESYKKVAVSPENPGTSV